MTTATALALMPTKRLDHLSFKGNFKHTRYGWLRLTPAYSVHVIGEILDQVRPGGRVLDPFCGTGTTALVCAERGLKCDTTDINPFLVWLAETKTREYSDAEIQRFEKAGRKINEKILKAKSLDWAPPLHQIEKWWDEMTLIALSHAMRGIKALDEPAPVVDLLKIVFCRAMIERANVSFGHQSMSFKKGPVNLELISTDTNMVAETWLKAVTDIAASARSKIKTAPQVLLLDARDIGKGLSKNTYDCVITSPPYPNRMSYIRELRPYMYWLGYLEDGRAAGELDWKAIGGTWGCATSNVGKWVAPEGSKVPFDQFAEVLSGIGKTSGLLANYVHKYFVDMVGHVEGLHRVVRSGGSVHYVVGNSKFYDVLLPVERIFASLFEGLGFRDVEVKPIRKRTSKKELFEFVVSAKKA